MASGGPAPAAVGARGSKMLGDRRALLVSSISTILFFVAIAIVIVLAPGSREVAHDFFSFEAMREALVGTSTTPSVLSSFWLNVRMFLVAEVLILVLALVIAVVRQMPGPALFPLRLVAVIYTDFFRGVPLLLVIYIMGFGIPGLAIPGVSDRSPVVLGVAALVLSYSAYVAEVYRAGIESVHESQVVAARSLGLSRWQSMRFVVLPQAVRSVVPPLLNDFISLQKDTALVAVLGPIEAARAAAIYGADRFNYSSFVVAALLFILLTIPLARFTDHLVARGRKRRRGGAMA